MPASSGAIPVSASELSEVGDEPAVVAEDEARLASGVSPPWWWWTPPLEGCGWTVAAELALLGVAPLEVGSPVLEVAPCVSWSSWAEIRALRLPAENCWLGLCRLAMSDDGEAPSAPDASSRSCPSAAPAELDGLDAAPAD
ncbi:hypothetical protein [Caulobacter sp. S45]|uniref:hypothetical protein n=1 Tax=Caulobacter sp. S45 TaxID=1641861 RepID=UPI00157535AE|nr:hypothetical protein [Caulobacter sp. S45]